MCQTPQFCRLLIINFEGGGHLRDSLLSCFFFCLFHFTLGKRVKKNKKRKKVKLYFWAPFPSKWVMNWKYVQNLLAIFDYYFPISLQQYLLLQVQLCLQHKKVHESCFWYQLSWAKTKEVRGENDPSQDRLKLNALMTGETTP